MSIGSLFLFIAFALGAVALIGWWEPPKLEIALLTLISLGLLLGGWAFPSFPVFTRKG